tara:strand:- start:839 stop:1783 length:945 start_codon:yes stop_codon:yes gene_type:complete
MKKNMVIIAARGIGDLIYHLPLLRSLYASYNQKLVIISNKVNHSKEIYKYETFYEKIIYFDNTRFPLLKTLNTIQNLKRLINQFNVDQLILTASPRRLMFPVYLSNAKKKIIFGAGNNFFFKDKKYQNLTHSEKIMRYTEDLNLPLKINDFFLKSDQLEKGEKTGKNNNIFITLDSHHDQNNWNIDNYIKIILKIIESEVKIFINFSPHKSHFLEQIPKEIINSNKVYFTHNKSILEIMNIINSCKLVIGNETGPICLGASLKKEVHSVYLPMHTKPESQIISDKTFYYNADKEDDEDIIEKISNRILKKNYEL